MLRVTPKSLNPVNMILGTLIDHMLLVFNGMVLAQPFEGIVASKLVRKVHRALSCFLSDDSHEFFSGNPLNNSRIYPSIAFQKAKYNAFTPGTTSALSLASAAEVALVELNLARQFASLKLGHMIDCLSQSLIHSRNRLIISTKIVSQFVCWLHLIETLEYRKFAAKLFQGLLFSTAFIPAPHISSPCSICFERTAENALSTPLKVGRTTENVLLSCNHMDILSSIGYDCH